MAVIKFLVYITCFCSSQVLCDDYGESGNEITLTPIIRGKPEEILWTHNGNTVLEYDGRNLVKYGSFKDRVDVDFETGQLTIRELNSQDSGKYDSEIKINGKVQTSSHTLTVLDALPKPLVTCELDETSNLKKLSCSVESQTQPSYEWSGPDIKQLGPTLLVDEQEEKRDSVYTCTVKNKAASRTTDFTLQDCHTGGVNTAVLVPVLIVTVLLIILLAVLVLCLYRHKKQKSGESEREKNYPENGECGSLLRNVQTEAMPGSPDATLPCHTRSTTAKESIADKKWDHDSESENLGKTHEGHLKANPQTAITENNKEDIGNTNEGELNKNEKNSEYADEAEEKANSEPDETDRETESQKTSQTQEEMEKEKSQILKNERENKELPEEQIVTQREQNNNENADKNEDDQRKKEREKKKKEENEEMNSSNTGSSDATLPCHTRLTAPKESIADKKLDHDSESENVGETNEKIAENADEAKENANSKPDETQSPKTEDADKNDKDQTTEEKKEMEEENKETDSPDIETVSPESSVTERSTMDTGNVEEQLHTNENNSQNEKGEQSPEEQNKSLCTSINEDDQRREEEKPHKGIGIHKAEPFNPASHSEASSDPMDSPADLEKEPQRIRVLKMVRQYNNLDNNLGKKLKIKGQRHSTS